MSLNHPAVDQIERTGYPRYPYAVPSSTDRKPECECGCAAKLSIHGKLRCWDCASDEGVEKL
jgi:hypothetical protein